MEQPPCDEYGPVRDRRDFEPLQLSFKRILPCPSRELSFSIREGCWKYSPSIAFSDRLGSTRESIAKPSTIIMSEALEDKTLSSSFHSTADDDECRTRKRLKGLNIGEPTKRPRIENNDIVDAELKMVGHSTVCDTVATAFSGSTSSSSSTGKSAVRNSSVVSNVVPKAALYSLYGKRKTQIASTQYLTWNNGARTHELKFSAIFVCPISCEAFLAGRYGYSYEEEGSIIWYSKKSLAEHAAAARAYDCFILRESNSATTPQRKQLGRDQPYHVHNTTLLPREVPHRIIAALESMRSLRQPQPANKITTIAQASSKTKNPPYHSS